MRSILIRGVFAAAAALTVACSSTDSVGPAGPLASARRTIRVRTRVDAAGAATKKG